MICKYVFATHLWASNGAAGGGAATLLWAITQWTQHRAPFLPSLWPTTSVGAAWVATEVWGDVVLIDCKVILWQISNTVSVMCNSFFSEERYRCSYLIYMHSKIVCLDYGDWRRRDWRASESVKSSEDRFWSQPQAWTMVCVPIINSKWPMNSSCFLRELIMGFYPFPFQLINKPCLKIGLNWVAPSQEGYEFACLSAKWECWAPCRVSQRFWGWQWDPRPDPALLCGHTKQST